MTAQKTPALFTTGIYSLRTPFTVVANILYTCQAIRSFAEMVAAGVDIYTQYYAPVGLTQPQYQADLAGGANLVTLMATGYPPIYVPDTYIDGYPQVGNVSYATVILAVSLGPIPDGLDYTFAKTQIQNDVAAITGVTPTVTEVVVPSTDVVTPQQAQNAEAARQSAITNRTSEQTKLVALQAQFNALQTKYNALEAWAVAHQG